MPGICSLPCRHGSGRILPHSPKQGAVHAAAVQLLAGSVHPRQLYVKRSGTSINQLACVHLRQARLGLPTIGLAPMEQWAPVSARQPTHVFFCCYCAGWDSAVVVLVLPAVLGLLPAAAVAAAAAGGWGWGCHYNHVAAVAACQAHLTHPIPLCAGLHQVGPAQGDAGQEEEVHL